MFPHEEGEFANGTRFRVEGGGDGANCNMFALTLLPLGRGDGGVELSTLVDDEVVCDLPLNKNVGSVHEPWYRHNFVHLKLSGNVGYWQRDCYYQLLAHDS